MSPEGNINMYVPNWLLKRGYLNLSSSKGMNMCIREESAGAERDIKMDTGIRREDDLLWRELESVKISKRVWNLSMIIIELKTHERSTREHQQQRARPSGKKDDYNQVSMTSFIGLRPTVSGIVRLYQTPSGPGGRCEFPRVKVPSDCLTIPMNWLMESDNAGPGSPSAPADGMIVGTKHWAI